jgi:hypothetical protein
MIMLWGHTGIGIIHYKDVTLFFFGLKLGDLSTIESDHLTRQKFADITSIEP